MARVLAKTASELQLILQRKPSLFRYGRFSVSDRSGCSVSKLLAKAAPEPLMLL